MALIHAMDATSGMGGTGRTHDPNGTDISLAAALLLRLHGFVLSYSAWSPVLKLWKPSFY